LTMQRKPFPSNFVWGAAAAAYQIEGAAHEDGKGLSVWDMFCRKPGAVWGDQSGEVACDHYHRYREDVALMQEIGLPAYRLSVSWPRIMPGGTGAVNEAGLDFYDRLIDTLLAANITPYVTLFHWDYPYELYCRGGWLNPDSPQWFADFARVVVDRLSDRVQHWFTINEPQCFIGLGHAVGVHAPGDKLGWAQVLRAAHHALLAHGRAVQVIRASARRPARVTFAPIGVVRLPASDTPADIAAARQAMFSITGRDMFSDAWFSDAVFLKRYPADGVALFEADMPAIGADDFEIIGQPLDFYAVNIYSGQVVRAGPDGQPAAVPFPTGYPQTAIPWYVTPDVLYWGPKFLYERYRLPIAITENGLANVDWVALDGHVHDPQRVDFLTRYLAALQRAGDDGVELYGYFHWSILDNFEWADGYQKRFGLVYVDYQTQKRTLKDSAHWYRQVIQANALED
jgi:beta-glucosidase